MATLSVGSFLALCFSPTTPFESTLNEGIETTAQQVPRDVSEPVDKYLRDDLQPKHGVMVGNPHQRKKVREHAPEAIEAGVHFLLKLNARRTGFLQWRCAWKT